MDEPMEIDIGNYRRQVRAAAENKINRLQKLGVPEKVLYILRKKIPALASRMRQQISTTLDHTGIIPVVPISFLSISKQLAMIPGGVIDGCDFDPTLVIEVTDQIPHQPYYMVEVDEGTLTVEQPLIKVCTQILNKRRFPLTIIECVAVSIHSDVLTRHGMWAGSTAWISNDMFLYLKPDNRKNRNLLSYGYEDEKYKGIGTPSCRYRL